MRTQQWMPVLLRKIMLKNSDDCDDSNEHAWSTDAAEVCDTFDNNCDGTGENGANVADEGVTTTYYADVDQDEFGNPESTMEACDLPEGYVTDNTDCDDSETGASVYPGNLSEEADPTGCYIDNDGDGFGDDDPAEGITTGTDCDDSATGASNNPNGVEICDGQNNDCDEETDEDASDAVTYYLR